LGSVVLALACVGATPAAISAQDTTQTHGGMEEAGLPPAGYGTLRQEDVAVRLQMGAFQLRVLPLDERVIRLLAPDSYASLHHLVQTMSHDIQDAAARAGVHQPALFLVTFFGLQAQARFVAEDVTITGRNRFFRPVAILPITPRWSEQQLSQRETATAVYLYEDGIALFDPFTVSYGGSATSGWEQTLPTLERERAAVLARAGRRPPG
jgi:hypothetical protein